MSDVDFTAITDDYTGSEPEEADVDDVVDDEPEAETEAEPEAEEPEDAEDEADDTPLADTPATKGSLTKLRNEAKNLRERSKAYDDAFEGMDDGQRDAFLGSAELYKTDQVEWARQMQEVTSMILGSEEKPEETPGEQPAEGLAFKTQADLEKYLTERDAKRDSERSQRDNVERMQRAIVDEAKGLGYEQGSPDYDALLAVAVKHHQGDLKAAHEALEKRTAEKAQAMLKAKRDSAKGTPKIVHGSEGVDAPKKMKFDSKEWREWADAQAAALLGK